MAHQSPLTTPSAIETLPLLCRCSNTSVSLPASMSAFNSSTGNRLRHAFWKASRIVSWGAPANTGDCGLPVDNSKTRQSPRELVQELAFLGCNSIDLGPVMILKTVLSTVVSTSTAKASTSTVFAYTATAWTAAVTAYTAATTLHVYPVRDHEIDRLSEPARSWKLRMLCTIRQCGFEAAVQLSWNSEMMQPNDVYLPAHG